MRGYVPGVHGDSATSRLEPTLDIPPWVHRLLPSSPRAWTMDAPGDCAGLDGVLMRSIEGERFALVSVRVPKAVLLDADDFRTAVADCYDRIPRLLEMTPAPHPVRLWNFVPEILAPLGGQPHRYMIFNEARFDAYSRWHGSHERFPDVLATASGVGHASEDLIVHCLAAPRPGEPVENPRQTAAYRYSPRYGPLPPCFARATRLEHDHDGRRWLLVGGTASVCGEESLHHESLEYQFDETIRNLRSLVTAAMTDPGAARGTGPTETPSQVLARFAEVRAYVPQPGDVDEVAMRIHGAFPKAAAVEVLPAELCRPELLVEIEGRAELPRAPLEFDV